MLLGKPVIATNWSSNTEFMNSDVACMVNYTFITIMQDSGPYGAGNRWADPDLNQAAEYMKELYENEYLRHEIGAKAKKHLETLFAPERAALAIKNRLSQICDGGYPLSRGNFTPAYIPYTLCFFDCDVAGCVCYCGIF